MNRKKIETFEDLKVWQKGISLVKQVYLVTKQGEISRDFGLKDQLRRAAISIPTNIAFVRLKGQRVREKGEVNSFTPYPLPLSLERSET
jgi:hypothetical protein